MPHRLLVTDPSPRSRLCLACARRSRWWQAWPFGVSPRGRECARATVSLARTAQATRAMAITFALDATKLAESANAPKDVVARDLKVDLFHLPAPTAAPLPGRPRLRLVAPIASTPPAPPATSLAAPVRLGLAPLLAPPPLAPVPTVPTGADKADPADASVLAEPVSTTFADVASAVIFGAYALARLLIVHELERTEQMLATAAAVATTSAFLASVALFSRSLVDALVGAALGITTLADIAAVTHGFESVPVISLIDQPVAAGLIAAFFLWRRARSEVPTEPHEHRDLEHQATNETVTLLVVASYFMIVPAFDMAIGAAVSVVTLQVAASGLLIVGSLPTQCIGLSSHTIALLVATLSATAREVALSS